MMQTAMQLIVPNKVSGVPVPSPLRREPCGFARKNFDNQMFYDIVLNLVMN